MIRKPLEPSLWYASAAAAPDMTPLDSTIETDVCIVGGGYTGLSTAIHLGQTGVRTAVLEAEQIGYGCSGRNAGHFTPTFHYYSIPRIREMVGEPRASRLIERQTNAATLGAELVRRYDIDCEWQQNGFIMAAHTPSAIPKLEKHNATYTSIGKKTRMLDRAEMASLSGSDKFFGGWLHPEAAHVNPLGYARGLARAAIQEGAQIFVKSKVIRLEPVGSRWAVITEKGRVLADKVICGTGAYSSEYWPGIDRTYKVQPCYVAATQPLSDNVRKTILPENHSAHDGRGDLFCYKYNKDGRIVASMFPSGRRGPDLEYTRQVMTDRLRFLYPQVGEVRWEYLWWGDIDMQRKTIPRLFDLAPGVIASLGYSGRGVPTGTMMGTVLADWARGVPASELAIEPEKIVSAPGYMSVAPRLMLRYFAWRDNRAARKDGTQLPPHAA